MVIQFNVPNSNPDCSINNPPVADQFPITSVQFSNNGIGDDWSVMTTGTNNLGELPFDRYGVFRPIAASVPVAGNLVDVWGFGIDPPNCTLSQTQQTDGGSVDSVDPSGTFFRHTVDATCGNSGSAVIRNGEILGIVTHCPCPGYATRVDLAAFAASRAALCNGGGVPPNDDCANRVIVGNGQTPFSTIGATTDGVDHGAGFCGPFGDGNVHNDVWFNYNANFTGTLQITTCEELGGAADFDTRIAAYTGCDTAACPPDGTTLLGCNDDDPLNPCGTPAGGLHSTLAIPVVAGNCYKIRVGGFSDGFVGTGTLNITKLDLGACCIWDGTCVDGSNAAACAVVGGTYAGDGTVCLGDADGDGVDDLCDPLLPQGANFFTDPAAFEAALLAANKRAKAGWNFKPNNVAEGNFRLLDDPLNIDTHALNPNDPWANFPSGDCCFPNGTPGCSDPACQQAVCAFDPFCCNTEWDFICAGEAAADPACDCIHVLGDLWPPTLDNVTFQSNLGPNPQPPVPNPRGLNALRLINAAPFYPDNNILLANFFVDSFDILSGPPAGDNHTAMSFEIVAVLGTGPGPVFVTVYDKNEVPVGKIKVPIVVNPPPPPPANDPCAGAIPIAVPSVTAGTTASATQDGAPFCGTPEDSPSVWYSVIGTGATLTATTCDAAANGCTGAASGTYDTKISVYRGGCAVLNCVTGNDDSCVGGTTGLLSTVTWASFAGQEYLIMVHGFGGQSGAFVLEVCERPPGVAGDPVATVAPGTDRGAKGNDALTDAVARGGNGGVAGGPQKKAFLGIIMDPGLTIGRVNLFDLNGGGEGISEITVYEDFTGASNADISGPDGPPDGCVDGFDLGTMLGAWCSGVNDPNPPSPPCENCLPANLTLADIAGPGSPPNNPPDGCVDGFDLAKLLAEWCSVAGGNPCGTCLPPP